MGDTDSVGYLRIANEADRTLVASILYKNGYAVTPARAKKNGKSYEYFVKYQKVSYDSPESVTGNES